ncbi:MAG: type III pantothenate kinase [Candidatus Omnitrophica bacterium]|nr:type III pantothenate kinase [Candidatus Omnitrophota bacterium]
MSKGKSVHLTVDIGNTTIAFAVMNDHQVFCVDRIDSQIRRESLRLQLGGLLRRYLRSYGPIQVTVVCSVVPRLSHFVCMSIQREFRCEVRVVGETLTVPMVNRYRKPQQVGQDRLVGAFAAFQLYGSPVIVIDLGTAITFDAVSGKGEYLGGVIVPGIRLSAEVLFQKTALLPKINIEAPCSVIGRSTQESILSGLFYGYGCLCRGLIELMVKQMEGRPYIVMTGGHTQLMKKFIKGVSGLGSKESFDFRDLTRQTKRRTISRKDPVRFIIDEHLVFKGMGLLLSSIESCSCVKPRR